MLAKLNELMNSIKATPCIKLEHERLNIYAKLEYMNMFGSVKDRPALNIIYQAVKRGEIGQDNTIIESSSGNMAIALASICNRLGLKFTAVIDPNINAQSENLLGLLSHQVVKVREMDETGGYLLNRIRKVREMSTENRSLFWTDQYRNADNYLSYVNSLGDEISTEVSNLDYVFVGVSSGGGVTGLSLRLKERFPHVKIIAVDVEGSVIFGDRPRKRYVSGIGSSMVPEILSNARIDEVVHVSQMDLIEGCHQLLREQGIFAGGSTGAVYRAINKYFGKSTAKADVLFLCVDRGTPYLDTVYNASWISKIKTLIEKDIVSNSITATL